MDDETAKLERLYREVGPDVRAYLRRRIGGSFEADDLLQETFLAVAANLEALERAGSKRAWLIGVARNLLRNHLGKRFRQREFQLSDEDPASLPSEREEDPRMESIRQLIQELPDAQREVLTLRLGDGLQYGEIAEAMGIPIGTVRSRLHHAVGRIKTRIQDREGEVLSDSRSKR